MACGDVCACLACRGVRGPVVTDKAYLDISVGGEHAGRLVVGLFGKYNPETVKNFKGLGRV